MIHESKHRDIPNVTDFCTAEQLVKRYDELGIDKGVILPIVSPEIYIPQTNEDILDMAEAYPDRLIPFCNIDPRAFFGTVLCSRFTEFPLIQLLKDWHESGKLSTAAYNKITHENAIKLLGL